MPRSTHRKVIPIGATARVVAQRAPETLTLVRHRTQSTAETIARLSVTAVFAYLVALPLPLTGAGQPILAPLTALLVVQVSLYQTLRSAVHRVAAVVTGVLLAIALADLAGFTWWSLGLTIAAGLAVGSALHLGDAVLEVPVSAMLILSNATRAAAVGRIAETAIGTAAGLIAGFVFIRPRLQPAEEAIEDLCRKLSALLTALLTAMADGLAAPGCRPRRTRCTTRKSGAGSPRCCASWPPRSPRTATSPPSTTPPRTTGWRPSWRGTWPRPVTSRTGWASSCGPIPPPARPPGRCAAS